MPYPVNYEKDQMIPLIEQITTKNILKVTRSLEGNGPLGNPEPISLFSISKTEKEKTKWQIN